MRLLAILLMLAMVLSGAATAAPKIQVFELEHRIPSEMVPALQPLLGPGVVMSSIGNKLVVKADRLKLAEIAEAINELDQPARRLMIEFREKSSASVAGSGVGVSGRAEIGDRAEVGVGGHSRPGVALGGYQARTRRRDDILQRVQTVEGRPAYLVTGEAVPVPQTSVVFDGPRVYRQHRTEYRNATVGFHVRPHVQGDRVVLDITRHAQRLRGDGRVFSLQDTGTRVRGRLGEWIDVGGVSRQTDTDGRGIAYLAQTRDRDDRRYQLRVIELD